VNFSFGKNEKLCSKKDIQTIFDKGEKFASYPFFFIFNQAQNREDAAVKVLITVSKKKFKKAVHRNRIKRLCREVYRLNKHLLIENLPGNLNNSLHLAIAYIATEELPYSTMHIAMQKSLKHIANEIKNHFS